jgi:hypothetical protein
MTMDGTDARPAKRKRVSRACSKPRYKVFEQSAELTKTVRSLPCSTLEMSVSFEVYPSLAHSHGQATGSFRALRVRSPNRSPAVSMSRQRSARRRNMSASSKTKSAVSRANSQHRQTSSKSPSSLLPGPQLVPATRSALCRLHRQLQLSPTVFPPKQSSPLPRRSTTFRTQS